MKFRAYNYGVPGKIHKVYILLGRSIQIFVAIWALL